MRETVRLLLTTEEKGRTAGSRHIWEKTEKQRNNRQPLISLSQVDSSQLRVPKSKPQPALPEKVLSRKRNLSSGNLEENCRKMTPVGHSGTQDATSTYLKITVFFLLYQIVIINF